MKNLKVFQNWSDDQEHESSIFESVFEDFKEDNNWDEFISSVNEDDEEDLALADQEEQKLTRGERIALAREQQILTKSQLAGLYLRALGSHQGDAGKYTIMIPGISDWGRKNFLQGKFMLTLAHLGEALGINSLATTARTVNKFRNLLAGIGDTEEEILYPKILKFYEEAKKTDPKELAMLAGESVQAAPTEKKERGTTPPELLAATVAFKNRQKSIGQKVDQLVKDMMRLPMFQDRVKTERQAISKIAKETGHNESMVAKAYQEYTRPKR